MALDEVPEVIDNATRESISEVESVIIETGSRVDDIYTEIEDQVSTVSP